MFIDPLYLIIVGPAMLLAIWASIKVKSSFAHGSKIQTRRGLTGAEAARIVLRQSGLDQTVNIEMVQGHLSDHYDPRHKVLRLSPDVYRGSSVASVGVAAHEAGHAIQDASNYAPLTIRNLIVPVAGFGSNASFFLFFIGLIMQFDVLMIAAIALFSAVVAFQLINLPVEFNASSRAREQLLMTGVIYEDEEKAVGKVLNAAAMTYVAATLTAVLTLVYFIIRSRE